MKGLSQGSNGAGYPIQIIDGVTSEPIIGATVINVTQNPTMGNGTATDYDGKTVLKDPQHRDLFHISYLGYATLKINFFEIREKKGIIKIYEGADILPTIVVTGRKDQPTEEIPYQIERVGSKQIAFTNAQTSADILLEAGAYIQKSQMGGGSPILRGFEANRVLLVVDGVRMNNAIYRSGHLQNSISIDNSILEQAEIIYGPGSLMYGSDALGGVIHYKTRDPKLHLNNSNGQFYQFTTNAYTRFSTANKEKTVHLNMDYGTDKWGSLTSLTYSDYGDLTAGDKRPEGYEDYGKRLFYIFRNEDVDEIRTSDPNIQKGTSYSQIDLLQKVKYQPTDKLYFVLNMQYSTTSNVPRYDVLQDTVGSAKELKWAEWYYGPQQRLFSSIKAKVTESSSALFSKASIIAGFQRIDEDRLSRKFRKRQRTFNLEDVRVFSFTADFDKYLDKDKRHTFSYGADLSYNDVQSSAGRLNINTGRAIYDELSRYPSGGSTMQTYAGYATYNLRSKNDALNLNLGGRFTSNNIDFNYLESDLDIIQWPEEYLEGLNISNNAMNWAVGLTYKSKDNWQFKGATSTAFRAPNLDDLAKVRPKNGKATVPNAELKPEYSLNYEATLGKQIGALDQNKKGTFLLLSATGFYTELTNAIVREAGTLPDGSDIIIVDEEAHDVQQNVNTGKAFIQGISGNARFNWNDRIILAGSVNYTKGRRSYTDTELSLDTLVAMDHIPPLYGNASLTFQTERIRIQGLVRFNGAKPVSEFGITNVEYIPQYRCYLFDPEGSADNIEYGLINQNPDNPCHSVYEGLPSWVTYNVYASYQFSPAFSVNAGLENITNVHYRNFGSGISAPGRNFSISLRGTF